MKKLLAAVMLTGLAGSGLSAQDVAMTYATRCAHCHGADGSGSTALGRALKILDLRSPDVKKLSPPELATIIARGMDMGRMPGFEKKLGTEMVVQLASYVHSIESRPPVLPTERAKARVESATDAKGIYAIKCAHCHGLDGSGNTILGRRMGLRDMRSSKVQQYSDSQLAAVIANGMDGGRMPGFQKKLGPEGIQQLASYVRVLMGGSSLAATNKMVRATDTSSAPASSASLTPRAQVEHLATSQVQADKTTEVHESRPAAPLAKNSRLAKLSSAIIPGAKNAPATEVIDLNSASKETLMTLPGITEPDALSIIGERPYKSSLQFRTRKIIAPEKYAQIADRVVAKQPPRAARSSDAGERTRP